MTVEPSGHGPPEERAETAASEVVDAAIEVHREFGPGSSEKIYRRCLVHELEERNTQVRSEVSIPVTYKGNTGCGKVRLDLLVDESLVVELKSVSAIERVHEKQLVSYLSVSDLHQGLLLNFDVSLMKDGIHRVIR